MSAKTMRAKEMELDPHGFFWRTEYEYRCVILHKARKIRQGRRKVIFCQEYAAETPEELIDICRKEIDGIGYEIGSANKVRELCNSAPRSWRQKHAAARKKERK